MALPVNQFIIERLLVVYLCSAISTIEPPSPEESVSPLRNILPAVCLIVCAESATRGLRLELLTRKIYLRVYRRRHPEPPSPADGQLLVGFR